MTVTLTFWLLAALAVAGAAAVVFSRDALRLVLGLGVFLLSIAGFYLLFGFALLAVAQVFVYVGGVLVLVLFSLLLLSRTAGGRLLAGSRADPTAAIVSAGLFLLLVTGLRGVAPLSLASAGTGISGLGDALLGGMLPAFELLGVLLLTALVAVMLIVGGEGR